MFHCCWHCHLNSLSIISVMTDYFCKRIKLFKILLSRKRLFFLLQSLIQLSLTPNFPTAVSFHVVSYSTRLSFIHFQLL